MGMNIIHVNARIACGTGHGVINLGDDITGRFDSGSDNIHSDAQRAIALLIRWGDLNQCNIDGQGTTGKKRGNL